MNVYRVLFAGVAIVGLAAREGGGLDLNFSTIDNSVDKSETLGSGADTSNRCARYTDPVTSHERQGAFDGSNCTYSMLWTETGRRPSRSQLNTGRNRWILSRPGRGAGLAGSHSGRRAPSPVTSGRRQSASPLNRAKAWQLPHEFGMIS